MKLRLGRIVNLPDCNVRQQGMVCYIIASFDEWLWDTCYVDTFDVDQDVGGWREVLHLSLLEANEV